MGLLRRVMGSRTPRAYQGPVSPEFGVPFGAVKAGLADQYQGQHLCWPMRVTQVRHEGGAPVRGVPLTKFLDCQYEGYDVWREGEAPFDWTDKTDSELGHFWLEVTVDPYRQEEQVPTEAGTLIAAHMSGKLEGASQIVVHGTLGRAGDDTRWAGPGATNAPHVNADSIYWAYLPNQARDWARTNPNFLSRYGEQFTDQVKDPDQQYEAAVQAHDYLFQGG